MSNKYIVCSICNSKNDKERYFCKNCGSFLRKDLISSDKIYELEETKIMRIVENLKYVPHDKVIWDDMIDLYLNKIEKLKLLFSVPGMDSDKNHELCDNMNDFLDLCSKNEFQIAFVGTIKTGKSTLINALLGRNYASMAVTPETAALTKFRSSKKDYVKINFYSKAEWKKLWSSRTSSADIFMKEYNDLNADKCKDKWVGHEEIYKELLNSDIEKELSIWSSSKRAEHYFVKEIEVGISTLPSDFPEQVVFVDTPGLSDPVAYRSDITKQYIKKANAVFVCVDAQKVQKEEIETISSVFSFSSHNKSKVHIIATHWDQLNDPIQGWKEQKSWLEKQLVGKGFFDTKKMANENIIHSAAFVYNLCRDFDLLTEKEKRILMSISFKFDFIDPFNLDVSIPKLKELSNINTISEIINNRLTDNYRNLLHQDISNKYEDILFNLKRVTEQKKVQMMEFINSSNKSLDEINLKKKEKEKQVKEITDCKKQLEMILTSVEKQTNNNLNKIINALDDSAKQRVKKNK